MVPNRAKRQICALILTNTIYSPTLYAEIIHCSFIPEEKLEILGSLLYLFVDNREPLLEGRLLSF